MKHLVVALCLLAQPLSAEPIKIVVDIHPVALVLAEIMDADAEIEVLIDPTKGAHNSALRPSQAISIVQADFVVFSTSNLSPGLWDKVNARAGGQVIDLSEGVELLEMRRGTNWEEVGHDDHEEGHDDHEEGHDGHDHGAQDPHYWLSPDFFFTGFGTLPDAFQINTEKLSALLTETHLIGALPAMAPGVEIVLGHDNLQYVEDFFGFHSVGALSAGDTERATLRGLAELRDVLGDAAQICYLITASESVTLPAALMDARVSKVTLDAFATDLPIARGSYAQLLGNIRSELLGCFG